MIGDNGKLGELIRDMETTTALMEPGLKKRILEFVNNDLRDQLELMKKSEQDENLLNIPYTMEQKLNHIKDVVKLKGVADLALTY